MSKPDIVERLEDYAEDDYYFDHKGSLVTTNRPIALREAAAEITRLREDNKKLSDKAEALRNALLTAEACLCAHGKPIDPAITAAIAATTESETKEKQA